MSSALAPLEREQQLNRWIAQQLGQPLKSIQLKPIANDAGFRRYFRFNTPSQWLAVDAPTATEDTHQFVALAHHFRNYHVNTPQILASDETLGFLLLEDFGDDLLYRHATSSHATSCYQQALTTLLKLQACPNHPTLIPHYDRALLHRELEIFSEWFVGKLLNYTLNNEEKLQLETLFTRLEDSAQEQPQCLVHRDFHSRNLIVRSNNSLGVIDFQGALWGGCTYDTVSLLRDCYVRLPAELTYSLALQYRKMAIDTGLLANTISEQQYLHWFDWMGLQRHMKVLGIFARLHLRDGKSHYLQDLPLVIRYILEVANAYPTLNPFVDWFSTVLQPIIQQQSWYSNYQTAGEK